MDLGDELFGSVPNIKYTGTKSSSRIRVVDNGAIPITYNEIIDPNTGEIVYKATTGANFNLVDEANPNLFTREFFDSFEFQFNTLIIKSEDFRMGDMNKTKIAIIGRSMGGGKRLNLDTGVYDFAYGVTDYALKLRSLGFKTRLFIRTQLDDLPYLTEGAVRQMKELVEQKAAILGMDPKLVELSDDEIRGTLAYALDVEWAEALDAKGYTVIDIGNPNGITKNSEFYNGERGAIFGH